MASHIPGLTKKDAKAEKNPRPMSFADAFTAGLSESGFGVKKKCQMVTAAYSTAEMSIVACQPRVIVMPRATSRPGIATSAELQNTLLRR